MTESGAPSGTAGRGLVWILGATVVAGAIGYLIQAAVPVFVDAEDYIVFSVFWSVVYLAVSGLSGLQQEVTRASTRVDEGTGWSTLRSFLAVSAAAAALVVATTALLWSPGVFGAQAPTLVAALLLAIVGYACVAVISGAMYGVRNWRGIAGMTVADSALRLLAVGVALLAGAALPALGWAVALPFLAAAVVVWLFVRGGVRAHVSLDTGLRGLFRHSAQTVSAALATGVMISGLPFLLGVTSANTEPALLASLILVVTLTRAPLVIPLLAIQSYLVVTFRDSAASAGRRVLVWGAGLVALTGLLSVAAVAVGPWVIELLYGTRYELPAAVYAAVVASAGLTSLLCLTGPAVLATGRHAMYLAGWAAASLTTIGCLFLPGGELARVLTALLVGPVVGVVIHAVALLERRADLSA